MAREQFVGQSTGPRFVGSEFPPAAEEGDVFLHEAMNPKALFVMHNDEWAFWGYLRSIEDADPGTAGYFAGGSAVGYVSAVKRLTFATEATSNVTSALTVNRRLGAGVSASSAGYAISGRFQSVSNGAADHTTTIDKLTFSTDNVASITSGVSQQRGMICGVNSTTAGYAAGGVYDVVGTNFSNTDKLLYSSDNVNLLTSGLTVSRGFAAGFESLNVGYVAGGRVETTGPRSDIDKLTFSTDAITANTSTLTSTKRTAAGYSSWSFGYACGGYNGSSTVSVIDRMAFANESVAQLSSTMTVARNSAGGIKSNAAGYAGGGDGGALTIDKLVFIGETTSTITSTLSGHTSLVAAFENLS